jgi:CRP/FNR family cyclic AMP-dependent transcriptional regulator
VLGEMALLDGAERSASIYALERTKAPEFSSLQLLSISQRPHRGLPESSLHSLPATSGVGPEGGRSRFQESAGAVAGTLLSLAKAEGTTTADGVELSSVVNYQLLTGLLCTNRESVSRAIRELRKMELIDKAGRRFLLKDLQGLSDCYQSSESSPP